MDCHCGNITENRDTGECASCGTARRKAERMKVKENKPIRKVSVKRQAQLNIYTKVREKFLLNSWCEVHGHPCVPTQVHHMKGRQNEDLLDTRYWLAVCGEAHTWITEHSKEAIEQGYSLLRTEKIN